MTPTAGGWWYLIALIPSGASSLLVFVCQAGTPGPNRFGTPAGPVAVGYGAHSL